MKYKVYTEDYLEQTEIKWTGKNLEIAKEIKTGLECSSEYALVWIEQE